MEDDEVIKHNQAIALVRRIKVSSDEDGAKLILKLVEAAQDKVIEYVKEVKSNRKLMYGK